MITKILILEDEISVLSMISNYFIEMGYKCETVSNYDLALTHLDKFYDFLIVDVLINNGSKTGLDFAKEYKKRHPICYIIAISGNESFKNLSDNFDCFVDKPFSLNNINNIIISQNEKSICKIFDKLNEISNVLEIIKKHFNLTIPS